MRVPHSPSVTGFLLLLSLYSCNSYYYSVPYSNLPKLDSAGDIQVSINGQFGSFKESGFQLASMPIRNLAIQFNRQKGSYNAGQLKYSYNELSLGLMKDLGHIRLAALPFYGLGDHQLDYRSASVKSRLQEAGIMIGAYLEIEDDFLIGGNLRGFHVWMDKQKRSGNFSGVEEFPDANTSYIFSPAFSLIYTYRFLQVGFHSGFAISHKNAIPHINERYGFLSLGINLNYKEFTR